MKDKRPYAPIFVPPKRKKRKKIVEKVEKLEIATKSGVGSTSTGKVYGPLKLAKGETIDSIFCKRDTDKQGTIEDNVKKEEKVMADDLCANISLPIPFHFTL